MALNRNFAGPSAEEWSSKAYAAYRVCRIVVADGVATAGLPSGGVYKDVVIDGDDATSLGFLFVPAGGNAAATVARSLDGGKTWIDQTALAFASGSNAAEKIEAAPLGWYRVTISAVTGTMSISVRKKVLTLGL